MSFDAGAIVGRMLLDISGYAVGLRNAGSLAQGFGGTVRNFIAAPLESLVGIAAAAGQALKYTFLGIADAAHSVNVEAARGGVSAGFLKQLGAAGKEVDLDISELGRSMAFLGRNASEAASGNETAAKAFTSIGVSAVDAGGHIKSTEKLFWEVADAIKALPSAAQQTNAAMDLLSRGGIAMVPILQKGSAGIRELSDELRKAGGGSFDGLGPAAEQFHHLEVVASAAWAGVKRAFTEPIFKVVADHASEFQAAIVSAASAARAAVEPMIRSVTTWVATHPAEIRAAIEGIGKTIGQIMSAAGSAISFVIKHLDEFKAGLVAIVAYKAIVGTLSLVGAAYTALTTQIVAATAAQTAFNLAQRGLAGAGIGAAVGGATTGGSTGGLIGGAAGGLGGGLIGQAVIPIPGVGFLIGAAIGGYLGGQAGQAIGNASGGGGGGNQTNNFNVNVNDKDSTLKMAEQLRKEIDAAQKRGWDEQSARNHASRVAAGLDHPWAAD